MLLLVCMTINGSVLMLIRSFSTALLILVDMRLFLFCFAGDQVLFLAYKLVRGDFWHWLPVYGVAGIAFSLADRFIVKTLVDFTSIVHF